MTACPKKGERLAVL